MNRREALAWLTALMVAPLGCRQVVDPRVPLRLATWGGAGDDSDFYRLVQSTYREFERQNPNVRLRVEGIPGNQEYVSKLLLDHIAGSMPDIITLDASSAAVFIDNDTLLDLTPYIERDNFDLGAFYPNVVDVARRGDSLYAIPTDFTPMVMYCNARLFRERRVSLPEGRWTFEEFLSKATDLTSNGVFGFESANRMPDWVMFLWNNGGDVLSTDGSRAEGFFDSSKSVGAVQFLADMVTKHKVAPTISQAAAAGVDLFATGKAAMKVSGHWNLVGLQASKEVEMDDVVVVELPTNLTQSATVMYEAGNAIGKKCRNPDLAWEFLKYWSSKAVQGPYNASGIAVSARRDVEEAKLAGDTGRELLSVRRTKSFQAIVPSARRPWGAQVEGYERVEDIGQRAMDSVTKNGVPVQEALSQAAKEIDLEFAKR